MPKLIVFLGNPGIQYRQTRHNAGWIACDHLLKTRHITDTWQTKFHAQYTKQGNAILLKPQTFMNVSGVSVQEAAKFYNIQSKDILVVHDDIELPFGTTKIQLGGGMGGHNGLRSIKQNLGTDQFMRLRIGVGRPPAVMQVADYVLGRFSPFEEKQLESTLDSISESIVQYMST